MNQPFKNLRELPKGMLLFLGIYALIFPAVWLELKIAGQSRVLDWLDLSPVLLWKGQVWRAATYALLNSSALGWAVNLFWIATLVSTLSRDWSSKTFWLFCLIAALGGALPMVLLIPHTPASVLGPGAMIFGLLVAWDRLYRHERLQLLGLGELSVRQAAIILAIINLIITFLGCGGWLLTISMLGGGVAGWLWFVIGHHRLMCRGSQIAESKRISRLEL